jgi:hypothetical protein
MALLRQFVGMSLRSHLKMFPALKQLLLVIDEKYDDDTPGHTVFSDD